MSIDLLGLFLVIWRISKNQALSHVLTVRGPSLSYSPCQYPTKDARAANTWKEIARYQYRKDGAGIGTNDGVMSPVITLSKTKRSDARWTVIAYDSILTRSSFAGLLFSYRYT